MGYRFGATYVGDTKGPIPGEAFPVLLGDIDPSGNTSATVLHHFGDNWRVKLQSQIQVGRLTRFSTLFLIQQSKLAAAHLSVERRGRYSTLGVTIANPNLVAKSGVIVGQYLRRITENLDLGVEMVYQRDRVIPGSFLSVVSCFTLSLGNQVSVLSYAVRYLRPNWIASATFGSSGLHACYFHKQAPNLQFGVEFESNLRQGETSTTFAYQVEVPEADMIFRASVDTNWTIGAVMEKKLSQQVGRLRLDIELEDTILSPFRFRFRWPCLECSIMQRTKQNSESVCSYPLFFLFSLPLLFSGFVVG